MINLHVVAAGTTLINSIHAYVCTNVVILMIRDIIITSHLIVGNYAYRFVRITVGVGQHRVADERTQT